MDFAWTTNYTYHINGHNICSPDEVRSYVVLVLHNGTYYLNSTFPGPGAIGPRAIGPRAIGPRAIGPRAISSNIVEAWWTFEEEVKRRGLVISRKCPMFGWSCNPRCG